MKGCKCSALMVNEQRGSSARATPFVTRDFRFKDTSEESWHLHLLSNVCRWNRLDFIANGIWTPTSHTQGECYNKLWSMAVFQSRSPLWDINKGSKRRLLDPGGLWAGRGYMYITCHACDTGSWHLLNNLVNSFSYKEQGMWRKKTALYNFSKVLDKKKTLTDLELKMQV